MLLSLHQQLPYTVSLHLFVRLCGFYLATGGLVNSHHCFTSGYCVQSSIMLYFVKFVQHRKNKLLESYNFCLFCSYHSLGFSVKHYLQQWLRCLSCSRHEMMRHQQGVSVIRCRRLYSFKPFVPINPRNRPNTAGQVRSGRRGQTGQQQIFWVSQGVVWSLGVIT